MLRQSCGDMTEEELAKLSVQLLNCQSEAEGRDVFTCTEDMVISHSYIYVCTIIKFFHIVCS